MQEKLNGIFQKKLPNILLFVILDILVLTFASILAISIRFDFGIVPDEYFVNSYKYLVFDAIVMLIVFNFLKLYTSVWKYASIIELIRVILGCFFIETTSYVFREIFNISMPRSYFYIRLLLMIILISGIRFSYRIIRTIYINVQNNFKRKHTMLIGGGEAGRLLIDEVLRNQKSFDTKIVCIIDDNKNKVGSYIRGIPICGTRQDIERMAEKYHIEDIIIAIPSAHKDEIAKIVDKCQKTKCNIKILPSIYLTMNENGQNIAQSIRPLSYEDFLGRNQIVVDSNEISENIRNKVIMVTGGGGSIGSELCRQIAKFNVKKLIIFDIYENTTYDIQQELMRDYPELDFHTIIGSVRDYERLEKIFKEFKPDQVFHAAAHKHVPLMEVSPNEAVKNNCLGTLNVCKLADKYNSQRLILISTDKAVRPTNAMGASKRICEMIVQKYDKISENTDYVAVRFGNVLGSNGSVIPLFLKQIDNGGPVTVTHKDIRRFFMTIPESVSLVLQAITYADGGEIFVLDMGKPIKIYDLAKKIIRYKGYEPNVDIKIKITGLRPGEKLYEETLMDEEGLKATPNKLINIGKPLKIPENFLTDLDMLIKSAYQNSDDIREQMAKIVTNYTVDKERSGQ